MKIHNCPHCDLPLELDNSSSSVLCPRCYHEFSPPRAKLWTVLIVPIVALHYWMWGLL
jgi:uncharacterized paraquat-inducible protein A